MTFTITKLRLAVAIATVALMIPATALADHIFDDVGHDEFYSESVEWAAANDLTTGVAPGLFAPGRELTRGELVTFLQRYHENMVIGLEETTAMFDSDEQFDDTVFTSETPTDLGLSAIVTVPAGRTGVIVATFAAESSCFGGDGADDWCEIDIRRDGVNIGVGDFAFDSTDDGTETVETWEGHSMTRITDELPAGTYVITVSASVSDGDDTTPLSFRLDERVLTAEVKITG